MVKYMYFTIKLVKIINVNKFLKKMKIKAHIILIGNKRSQEIKKFLEKNYSFND